MAKFVFPPEIPVVSSLPSASSWARKLVVYNNSLYYSDGTSWYDLRIASDSDTVDGFHASQTPSANTIPVADASGKLNVGWLNASHTGATGTGKFVFDNSPTITSPTISGNFNLSVTTITSSTTAADYATYIINAQSGNVTLTLPSAATYISRRYTIMRMDTYQHSSSYKAIIASAAGEKINGVGIVNLANFDSITVQSNGSNWIIK